jgi:hypothetical protein
MSADAGFVEVEKQAGKQFDPRAAAAFLEIRDRIIEEMQTRRTTVYQTPDGE